MYERTPRDRLNQAAELLGMPQRLAPECGQAVWTDMLIRIIEALAQAAQATPVAAKPRKPARRRTRAARR